MTKAQRKEDDEETKRTKYQAVKNSVIEKMQSETENGFLFLMDSGDGIHAIGGNMALTDRAELLAHYLVSQPILWAYLKEIMKQADSGKTEIEI